MSLSDAANAVEAPRGPVTRSRRGLGLAVAFLLLPTVILAGAWRLGGVSALEDDLLYYLPVRQYIGERVAAGEWPAWNPLVGMGTSIAADPQSGLWYPPTLLFAVLPSLVAYPLTIILHFALAGWGMYRFLRAVGRDWQAAFLGAIAFEFCGFLIAHRVHLTMHHAVAWMPWILYGWQRFADRGRYPHFALAAGAFGLQMLVQHTQISIMTAMIVTAYVGVVLLPGRFALLWQYPLGMTLGAAIGAVQTLPTLLQLAGSGRGVATFSTFVENSWMPSSGVMMLFPMFFGSRTPNLWGQEWWGLSHFCEQFAYGSIAILVLAIASSSLLKKSPVASPDDGPTCSAARAARQASRLRREVIFWWAASAIALVIALGQLTPVSRLLFEVPIYRNLRVPARWILVWSLAMPVLASAVVAAIRQGGPTGERAARAIRFTGLRLLPAGAIACVLFVSLIRWRIDDLQAAFGHFWGMPAVLDGLRVAVRPGNPAFWWPIIVMAISVAAILHWAQRRDGRSFVLVFVVMLVDLAGVAAFVDVDARTYTRRELIEAPPLARAIGDLQPDPGHRLLVPRFQADYQRPLEVLWPETNLRQGVATFNAYGPFWPKSNRLLFRFMPWGSSEAMLELLRHDGLRQAMGIRFLAARSPEEHAILAAMQAPRLSTPPAEIAGTHEWQAVVAGDDVRWPVRVEQPGIYELRLEAGPGPETTGQWFVRLETPEKEQVGFSRRLEPVDLSQGARPFSFLFVCPEPPGDLYVRVKSEAGHVLSVRRAKFGRVAELGEVSGRAGDDVALRTVTSDGVSLFECREAVPLVRIARAARPVPDLISAVNDLLSGSAVDLPSEAVYEASPGQRGPGVLAGGGTVTWVRPRAEILRIEAQCQSESLLVFNESHDPGWRAEVNGEPVRTHRVNAVVQGVVLPGGSSQVTFRYRPPGLRPGGLITAFSLVVLANGAVLRRHGRSAHSRP